jgi:DNA repair protein RecO (recombination protein O)
MGDASRDDHSESPDLYRLMAVSLSALDREDRDPLLVVRAFEIRLMCMLGFMPVLDTCAACGGDLPADGARFGFSVCGVVCGKSACQARAGERLFATDGALACMRYLRDAPIERLFSFRMDRRDFDSLSQISERFVSEQMEKRYGRLDLLSKLQPIHPDSSE